MIRATPTQLRKKLFELGHYHASFNGAATWPAVAALTKDSKIHAAAARSYQRYSQLKVDGRIGNRTQTALVRGQDATGAQRMCGCADIEPVQAIRKGQAKIPNGTSSWSNPELPITLAVDFALPGLTKTQVRQAFQAAFDDINSKIGVRLRFATRGKAHTNVDPKSLSDGTLAWSYLHHEGDRQIGGHKQAYDTSNRRWSLDTSAINLVAVIVHECGHLLGFSHSQKQSEIMYPSYQSDKLVLQPGDVGRMIRYYPKLDTPEEPKRPKGKRKETLRFRGVSGDLRPFVGTTVIEYL